MFPRRQAIHVFHGFRENRQGRQPQEVELHQSHVFNVFFVVLTDRVLGFSVRVIKGTEIRQLSRGNQHTARVHPEVAGNTLEFAGIGHQTFVLGTFRLRLKVGFHLKRLINRNVHPGFLRNEFCEGIDFTVTHVERTPHVTHHGLGTHGTEGHDLTYGFFTVSALHILNRTVAVVLTKVHVKVRHGNAFRVQESFEQQPVVQRIQIRNSQTIRHQGAGARPTPGPHRHAVAF